MEGPEGNTSQGNKLAAPVQTFGPISTDEVWERKRGKKGSYLFLPVESRPPFLGEGLTEGGTTIKACKIKCEGLSHEPHDEPDNTGSSSLRCNYD